MTILSVESHRIHVSGCNTKNLFLPFFEDQLYILHAFSRREYFPFIEGIEELSFRLKRIPYFFFIGFVGIF